MPGLVAQASAYSVGALLLLILLKGIAYGLCLGSFRGGPTFPALFLGVAAGIAASRLPGFPETAAVAVGMASSSDPGPVPKLPLMLLTSRSRCHRNRVGADQGCAKGFMQLGAPQ